MASMAINESDMSMPRMRIGQLRANEAIKWFQVVLIPYCAF
jgi:hypothetical protein